MKHYADTYVPDSARGHAVALFEDARPTGDVVVDLGCGHGTIAEAVADLGYTYVGLDIDEPALAALAERGFEAHHVGLAGSEDDLVARLTEVIAGRPLAGFFALDVFEHLADPRSLTRALRRLAGSAEDFALVVSMPNVTHFDVGAKLLIGRWDTTEEGLLDTTHLQFYSEDDYRRLFVETGWGEVAAHDVVASHSDQCFPADAAILRPGAPLHDLLWNVRAQAEAHGTTYQFVRRFVPAGTAPERRPRLVAPGPGAPSSAQYLATVVVIADGDAAPDALLGDLGAQHDIDGLGGFDVVVVQHDDAAPVDFGAVRDAASVTTVTVSPGTVLESALGAALEVTSGRVFCVLDASCRLTSTWLATVARFQHLHAGHVGVVGTHAVRDELLVGHVGAQGTQVVRDELLVEQPLVSPDALAAQGRRVRSHVFDLLYADAESEVCVASYVLPREVVAAMGLSFVADEGPLAWPLFLHRAVMMSGLRVIEDVGVVAPESSVRPFADIVDAFAGALGAEPLLFGSGTASALRIVELHRRLQARDTEVVGLAEQAYSLGFHLGRVGDELATVRSELEVEKAKHVTAWSFLRRKLRH